MTERRVAMGLDKAKALFVELVAKVPQDQWDARLAELAGGDDEVRQQVSRILAAHRDAGSFLESPAPSLGATIDEATSERPGTVIGPYKLLEQLGEGGMGNVWMAQQTEPVKRLVAIKLIKLGMDSKQVLARFEAERQALAVMDHPNIAKVLDAGTTDGEPAGVSPGRPYFVMELVKGVPITKYCDEHRLTPRQRLELFVPVCHAIQHAHQKGIIHRDLKPSNVLVALYDDRPVPKVIDFGVAKATGPQLTEETLHTGFGAVVGTIEYMSPEQASFNQLDVDTRSDIYSLGVLLYELLAGSPPFTRKKAGVLEMLRLIREQEPSKPSTKLSTAEGLPMLAANRGTEPAKLTKLVRGELDWIVMKALEKDRNRRYETANGFAMDVQRCLADEPVLACPPSRWYRFRKFARRNKAGVAIGGLILFFLVLLGGSIGWTMRERALRGAEIAVRVETALAEANDLRAKDRWPEALQAAKRAEVLLAGEVGEHRLRQQSQALVADLEMLLKLEEIRFREAERWGAHTDFQWVEANYAQAFRDYGIDVEELGPQEAATFIQSRSIAVELAAALDHWALLRKGPRLAHLRAVASAADPDPWREQVRRALVRQDGKALVSLARSEEALSLPPPTLTLLGTALGKLGEAGEAAAFWRRAQQRYPTNFWSNQQLANHLAALGPARLEEAIGFYRAALAVRPDSLAVHTNLGVALSNQGNLDEAIAHYQEARRLQPNYPEAHYNLGNALSKKGLLEEAIVAYQEAIRLNLPRCESAHYNLGNALMRLKRLDDAIVAYQEATRLNPDFAEAYHNLGGALRDKRRLDEAVTAYKEAVRLKESPESYTNLGTVLGRQGKFDDAIRAFTDAIRLKPDHVSAYSNLGYALLKQGKLDAAIEAYRKVLDLIPDDADAHLNLGNALQEKGNLDEAIAAFREAIRLKPDFEKAHVNLGIALGKNGRPDDEIAAYEKALKVNPDYAEASYNLGNALDEKGNLDEAIAAYREVIRLQPDHAEAHCNLGSALQRKGQFAEALATRRRGHELGSKQSGWRYPSARWVREAERLVQLDTRLATILNGEQQPADAEERVALAELCRLKRLYTTSAQFWRDAFEARPQLAGDLQTGHRYNAVCAAALAGSGQGADAGKLTEPERGALRRQALEWLRADLAAWGKELDADADKARATVRQQMQHWLQDPDFAGVRDPGSLAQLPEAERQEWHKLWEEVKAMGQRAARSK